MTTCMISKADMNAFREKAVQRLKTWLSATTPENKNLWLSLIEGSGDAVINLLMLKNHDNQNVWLGWLRDQCGRLDALSADIVNEIDAKIRNMDASGNLK
jgi:hypothetical protein